MLGRKINENIIINIVINFKGIKYEYLYTSKLDAEKSLGRIFKDFSRLKNRNLNFTYHIYL
jgi:hypothetical protein